MTNISILGLGAMGSRMARRLLDAGHSVTVWNRSVERTVALRDLGAIVARSPRDAAANAEFVISMVRDDEASHTVWLDTDNGALAGMTEGAIAIESSTLSIEWIRQLGATIERRGYDFVDAPVAGSRPQADAGQLIYFAGGNGPVVERCTPILRAMSIAVHHTGPSGSGTTVKLCVNALFGIQVAALAELIGLLKKSGMDVAKTIEILGATPLCSPAAKGAAASMLAGNFTPLFPVELIEKDLRYTQAAAAAYSASLPMTDATRTIMANALSNGMGADHLTCIARLYDTC